MNHCVIENKNWKHFDTKLSQFFVGQSWYINILITRALIAVMRFHYSFCHLYKMLHHAQFYLTTKESEKNNRFICNVLSLIGMLTFLDRITILAIHQKRNAHFTFKTCSIILHSFFQYQTGDFFYLFVLHSFLILKLLFTNKTILIGLDMRIFSNEYIRNFGLCTLNGWFGNTWAFCWNVMIPARTELCNFNRVHIS